MFESIDAIGDRDRERADLLLVVDDEWKIDEGERDRSEDRFENEHRDRATRERLDRCETHETDRDDGDHDPNEREWRRRHLERSNGESRDRNGDQNGLRSRPAPRRKNETGTSADHTSSVPAITSATHADGPLGDRSSGLAVTSFRARSRDRAAR